MMYGLDIPTTGAYADAHTLVSLAAEAGEAGWDGFFLWDVLVAKDQPPVPVIDPWIEEQGTFWPQHHGSDWQAGASTPRYEHTC
jgi:hypothetical protein